VREWCLSLLISRQRIRYVLTFVIIYTLSELVQLKQLRFALSEQIEKQRGEVEDLRLALESKIKIEVEGRIRDQLRETVKVSIREKVQEKVHEEVSLLVSLHKKILSHGSVSSP
jgi:DNA repair exonuclease SbcCD ATPase subunit